MFGSTSLKPAPCPACGTPLADTLSAIYCPSLCGYKAWKQEEPLPAHKVMRDAYVSNDRSPHYRRYAATNLR